MTDPDLNDDEVLLEHLRDALDSPIPADAVEAARGMFGLRRVDEELAELTADSLVDTGVLVRRDGLDSRLLSFAGGGVTVDVELGADGRTLIGVVSPPRSLEIEVEMTTGTTGTRSDDFGRFRAELGDGRVRLRLSLDDHTIVTPWISR